MNYKDANMQILAERHPRLYQKILHRQPTCPGKIISNESHDPNLLLENDIYLHNFAAPWQEADEHLTMLPDDFSGIALFCGLGLGYWPLRMLANGHRPSLTIIIEPETDIFLTALELMDMSALLKAENVMFFIGDIDWQEFKNAVTRIAIFETTCFFRLPAAAQWRLKSYKEADDNAYAIMNSLNIQGATLREKGPIFFRNTMQNLTLLRHSPPTKCLRGIFKDQPAIVVAAGPSLANDLDALRQVVGKCIIIAVDSVVKPLLEADIVPDIITSIDFQELNFEKLAPLLGRSWPLSLISLVKENPMVPKRIDARHTFLAFQDDEQDTWLTRALRLDSFVTGGSSVAHLALGAAKLLGASPICLIGQDLAYPESGSDHVKGTVFTGNGLPEDRDILTVPGVNGTEVKTDRCFLEFRNQFEEQINSSPAQYINLTSSGAHIKGTTEMTISEAARKFFRNSLQPASTIDMAVDQTPPYAVDEFMEECRLMLKRIKDARRQINELKKMAAREITALRRDSKKGKKFQSQADLPPGRQRAIIKLDRLSNKLDNDDDFWRYLQDLSLDMFHQNQKALNENQALRESGDYHAWLLAELRRIREVNNKRDEILTDFEPLLARLYSHLKAEKGFSEDTCEHNLTAVRQYLLVEDIALADKALKKYNLQTAKLDDQAEFYQLRGTIMAHMLNFEQANKDWQQAEELRNDLQQRIHKTRQELGRFWLKLIVPIEYKLLPQKIDEWIARAVCLSSTLTANEVKEMYDGLDLKPDILTLFARQLLEYGSFDNGIAVLQEAVARDPVSAALWEEIGDALMASQDWSSAMQAYQYCYQAQPQNITALEKFKTAAINVAR